MNGLEVVVFPPTASGRLHPMIWDDIGHLVIQSAFDRPWPFGANIDSLLILDFDSDRLLSHVELIIPRSLWSKVSRIAFPSAPPGNLRFSPGACAQENFDLSVRVQTDATSQDVRIEIGEEHGADRIVALSETCVALISGNLLAGFVIRGPIPSPK